MVRCIVCSRSFRTRVALNQHMRDSPVHELPYNCSLCDRSFGSQDALRRHTRDSPAHKSAYHCSLCNRSFNSQDALDRHTRDSPAHFQLPTTPLNEFFQSFPGFAFDPNLPPAESYARLQKFYRWGKGDPDSERAWAEYQQVLVEEFNLWFGSEDDIGAWHSLCRAVRINPLPETCSESKKVVRRLYVNIVDLIDWARQGRNGDGVHLFKNLEELREYTKRTHKIFHNDLDSSGGHKAVLRHLLRPIFR